MVGDTPIVTSPNSLLNFVANNVNMAPSRRDGFLPTPMFVTRRYSYNRAITRSTTFVVLRSD